MPTKPIIAPEALQDVHFPRAGVDRSLAAARQPARPLPDGSYAKTTYYGKNVRAFEPGTARQRGGQRGGLTKYIPAAVVAGWIVQQIDLVVGVGYTPPGGAVQVSQSGRVVTLVAVSQGNVYVASAGATSWTAALNGTGDTPPLNFTGVMQSAQNGRKLFFDDGVNQVYYDPTDNTVHTWAATAGTLPADSGANTPRLICTWRGRTVRSGLLGDPQNIFMSAVSDPFDWDYSPADVTPTQAVALNLSPLGLVGDDVTALIPYSDDVLLVGGDHTVYLIRGDPAAGGNIDRVSDAIGIAWGQAWCKDPAGTVYFFANRPAVYSLVPGQQPVRVSQAIERLLRDIDTGTNVIRLLWDDRAQGLHVFVTPSDAPAAATRFFYEQRSGAWWVDEFANDDLNPVACCAFDGNLPGDRVALIGSWDGYVRAVSPDATDDDGTPITSEVWLGPVLTKDLDEVMLKDLQAVLGVGSGVVFFAVYVGASAEEALASTAVVAGTWSAGRNLLNLVRRAGHAVYIRIVAVNPWAFEVVRARLAASGKVRHRGH